MSAFLFRRLSISRFAAITGLPAALLCLAALCAGCGAPGPTTGQNFRDLFGASRVDDEIQGLSNDDPAVRRWSINRLTARGRIDLAPDITLLVSRKLEESPDVRAAAAAALRQMSIREAAPFLARNLDDPSPFVMRQVIEALGSIGSAGQVPDLLKVVASKDQPGDMRCAAARAVGQIGDESAAPGLIENLDDPNQNVAAAVHEALVQVARTDMGLGKGPWQRWWDNLPKPPAGGATR
jgi:HEAT repeat protein